MRASAEPESGGAGAQVRFQVTEEDGATVDHGTLDE